MSGNQEYDPAETGCQPEFQESATSLFNKPAGSLNDPATFRISPDGVPHPPSDFPTGSRFRDAHFIGAGGMGWVYKVFDPQGERWVAVKLLHSHDPESRVRFTLEARALAQLDHPHIVKLLEVGEIAGIPFLSMPVLEGHSLLSFVERMSLAEKVNILCKVSEAVHSAHQRGILHRDLKPANIMVVENSDGTFHPYVMDFGLALVVDSPVLTKIGQVMGTVLYMSPEQARGDRMSLDVRSDVYSLGVTAYHFLCGHPPFKGDSSLAVLQKVLEEDPRSIRELTPTIPEDLGRVVHKAMEKLPSRRYESARAFADDLRSFSEGRPVHAQPPTLTYRASKWVSRHRLVANTLAVSLVSLVLVGGWAAWTIRRVSLQAAYSSEARTKADTTIHELQLAWTAPAHMVLPHTQKATLTLQDLSHLLRLRGAMFRAPAAVARGRILLEMGKLEPARTELRTAWESGSRTPEVALALGETLHLLYYSERSYLQAQGPTPAALERLEREFLRPAQEMLALGKSPAEERFTKAKLLDLSGRSEEALPLLERLLAESPWRSDVALQQVFCWESIAWRKTTAADPEGARQAWGEADKAMERALDLARSNPELHHRRVQLLLDIATFEADHGKRGSFSNPRIKAALEAGLQINPENANLLLSQAEWLYRQALAAKEAGQPERVLLEQAITSVEKGVALSPTGFRVVSSLGRYLLTRLEWDFQAGGDTGPDLTRALGVLDKLLALHPNDENTRNLLVYVHYMRGQILARQGQDPRPAYIVALDTARLVAQADKESLVPWGAVLSLQNTLIEADLAFATDPAARFAEGTRAGDLTQKAMPDHPNLLTDLGRMDRFAAAWALAQGRDPSQALVSSEEHLRKALTAEPRFREAYQELGELGLIRARAAARAGRSDLASLAAAAKAFGEASRLAPDQVDPLLGITEAGALALGPSGAVLRRQGETALREVRRKQPNLPRCRAFQGALILAGLSELPAGSRPKQAQEALRLLEEALAKDLLLRVKFAPWKAEAERAAR